MSRSGSTLLCGLMDQYEDISVGIEGYFPDNIVRRAPVVNSLESLDKYLNLLYQDRRFRGWNIEQNKLKEKLVNIGFPLSYKNILLTCLFMYFEYSVGKVLVHKSGHYISHFKEVKKIFPHSKIIYIARDPRAIMNSQINSGMSKDPLSISLTFKKQLKLCQEYMCREDFLFVQYEQLIKNTRKELDRVLSFFNLENQKRKTSKYADRIPDDLQYLHENVSENILEERTIAWRKELEDYYQLLIQTLCINEIRTLDLPVYEYEISIIRFFKLIFHITRYFLRREKHRIQDFFNKRKFVIDTLIDKENIKKESL
ncbi:MAG: sulfotransferase [Bacteroidales bacterium]|nr:sulfotransferase [Bacteroidales bacterium]